MKYNPDKPTVYYVLIVSISLFLFALIVFGVIR
jgi:hypothetical protein